MLRFWKKEPVDIWGNIQIPDHLERCPCCGVDRSEIFGLGHQASCYYGSGKDHAGAKQYRARLRRTRS